VNPWPAIEAVDDWLHTNRVLVMVVSVGAMVLSTLHYAGFIRLPELWHLPAAVAWIIPALRYGFWEAAVTPKLRERRACLEGKSND
jgi:hypothetical protein